MNEGTAESGCGLVCVEDITFSSAPPGVSIEMAVMGVSNEVSAMLAVGEVGKILREEGRGE